MSKRMMIWALALILLLGAFPLLSLLLAVFRFDFGCQLDEGSVHPCVVLSLDFGGLLYPMAVGGWFVMFTIPLIATTEGNCIAVTDGLSAERVSE